MFPAQFQIIIKMLNFHKLTNALRKVPLVDYVGK